jgi:hypothetical protein
MKNLRTYIAISLTVLVFIAGGCGKKSDSDVPVNTAESGVVLSDPPKSAGEKYLSIIAAGLKYQKYNKENDCYINEDSSYCVYILDIVSAQENGVQYLYAIEKGTPLDENMKMAMSLTDFTTYRLFKFELQKDNNLKIIAEGGDVCGSPDVTCTGTTYKVGNGPELGWLVNTGYMRNGNSSSRLHAYAVINKKIQPIFSIQTFFSDEGTNRVQSQEVAASDLSTTVTTVPSTTEKFSDLRVVVSGNNEGTPVNFSTTLKFDGKTNTYNTKAIEKVHEWTEL